MKPMTGLSVTGLVVGLASAEILLYFFYSGFVINNLVFTFDELTVGDVPYYSTSNPTAQTQRYNWVWWEYTTDTFRLIPPMISLFYICFSFTLGYHDFLGYIIVDAIILALEILKVIAKAIEWAVCSNFNPCRNFNPSGPSSSINYVFLTDNIMGWVFLFFTALLFGSLFMIKATFRTFEKEESAREELATSALKMRIATRDITSATPVRIKTTKSRNR